VSQSFTQFYYVVDLPVGGYIIGSAVEASSAVSDEEDSVSSDVETHVNDFVLWTTDTDEVRDGTFRLIDVTTDGDPVLEGAGKTFVVSNNANLGPNVTASSATEFTYCFAEGIGIATPMGDVVVEDLCIGDPLLSQDGRVVPVKWIGRQTLATRFGMAERLRPIRVQAGALGPDVPKRDLTVTADHALLVDGVLCNAGALVNGVTITQVPCADMGTHVTVYHVETECREIILAEGAPVETFIDTVSRRAFDNFEEYEVLYGKEPEMVELPYPRAGCQCGRSGADPRRSTTGDIVSGHSPKPFSALLVATLSTSRFLYFPQTTSRQHQALSSLRLTAAPSARLSFRNQPAGFPAGAIFWTV